MAHSTQERRSPTVHTTTPDAVPGKFNRPAIDLNLPPPDDPMDNEDPNSSVSNCKSVVPAYQSGAPPSLFSGSGLMELSAEDMVHRHIKQNFVSSLAGLRAQVNLVAIHRNHYSDVSAKARAEAFQVCSRVVQRKGGDNTANVKFAWYATSKEEVSQILSYGFGYNGKPADNGVYGCGVYFAPFGYPLESVLSAPIDEDGLRHLLLCRVIMGKSELVSPRSKQSHSSLKEYDSGVDDLSFPKRYIIWSNHVNTRVLPVYIISFRAPYCLRGFLTNPEKLLKSATHWTPLLILIWELSKCFPPSLVSSIYKYHKDHKDRKFRRYGMIQKFWQRARDRLLMEFMKGLKNKERKTLTHEQRQMFKQIAADRLLIEIVGSFVIKEGKIPRHEVRQKFKQIAGDRLLIGIIKILRNKVWIMISLINSSLNAHYAVDVKSWIERD
ncbi:hypothetical protein BT93_C0963 [Corymbia citriodora subsp. variegata]|nr:hypothetical protein BT93_C0963 [Corymbia citriodora subsp. variegata]